MRISAVLAGIMFVHGILSVAADLESIASITRRLRSHQQDLTFRRLVDTFPGCDADEIVKLKAAKADAFQCACDTIDYLGKLDPANNNDYFKKWFGSNNAEDINEIKDNFQKIKDRLKKDIKFNCTTLCSDDLVYSAVDRNDDTTVYVCKPYFGQEAKGKVSRMGILIHEVSHFTSGADTNSRDSMGTPVFPEVIGQTNSTKLADDNPLHARNNADNHMFFLECLPGKEESSPTSGPTSHGGGDPHFSTWSGERFSFHGECDLVLVRNRDFAGGLGMDIHGRTKIHRDWSAFESAAVRIGNDIFEVQGKMHHWVNGVANAELPVVIGGYEVTLESPAPHIRRFTIHLGKGEKIHVKTFNDFVWVDVEDSRKEDFIGSYGLLGAYESGHEVARDGKTIITDPTVFGQEWQVRDTDPQLFHSADGPQYPQQCKMPTQPKVDVKRRRLSEGISYAKKACANARATEVDDCIADVQATNDVAIAGAYE
jgi:hypothetical protein